MNRRPSLEGITLVATHLLPAGSALAAGNLPSNIEDFASDHVTLFAGANFVVGTFVVADD